MSSSVQSIINTVGFHLLVGFFGTYAVEVKIDDLSATMIETELRKHGIIPDVIGERESPNHIIKITYTYPNKNETRVVTFGNNLQPSDLYEYPNKIEWPGYFENDYCLIMVDLDAPSRIDPSERERVHWLIVNIPGNVVRAKDTLFEYIAVRGQPKEQDFTDTFFSFMNNRVVT